MYTTLTLQSFDTLIRVIPTWACFKCTPILIDTNMRRQLINWVEYVLINYDRGSFPSRNHKGRGDHDCAGIDWQWLLPHVHHNTTQSHSETALRQTPNPAPPSNNDWPSSRSVGKCCPSPSARGGIRSGAAPCNSGRRASHSRPGFPPCPRMAAPTGVLARFSSVRAAAPLNSRTRCLHRRAPGYGRFGNGRSFCYPSPRLLAVFAKEDVVILFAIERGIEVNQIHAGVGPLRQHFQAIAVIQGIGLKGIFHEGFDLGTNGRCIKSVLRLENVAGNDERRPKQRPSSFRRVQRLLGRLDGGEFSVQVRQRVLALRSRKKRAVEETQ